MTFVLVLLSCLVACQPEINEYDDEYRPIGIDRVSSVISLCGLIVMNDVTVSTLETTVKRMYSNTLVQQAAEDRTPSPGSCRHPAHSCLLPLMARCFDRRAVD